jgi:hypothetical protein
MLYFSNDINDTQSVNIWHQFNLSTFYNCFCSHRFHVYALIFCFYFFSYFNYITQLINDTAVKPHKYFLTINAFTMEPVPLFNRARFVLRFSNIPLNMPQHAITQKDQGDKGVLIWRWAPWYFIYVIYIYVFNLDILFWKTNLNSVIYTPFTSEIVHSRYGLIWVFQRSTTVVGFFGSSSFLPQGKLTGWVRIT